MAIITTILDILMSILNSLFGGKTSVPAASAPKVAARAPEPEPEEPEEPEEAPVDWMGWEGLDPVEFWTRAFAIEEAESKAEQLAKTQSYGLPTLAAFEHVKDLFLEHFGDDADFMQAAATARMGQMQGWMEDAVARDSGLLEPIDGVSVETWATIAAALSTMGDNPEAYHRLLASHDLDAPAYEAAQAGWIQRMQSVDDPMAAGAIAQIYGKAFTSSRTGGAFTGAANAAGATMGQPGQAPDSTEPCSFDKYCELMGAQSAWAKDGHDVNAKLAEVFGLKAVDFSDIGAYWSAKMMSDFTLAGPLGERMEHYEAQYRSTDDADADLAL